MYRRAPQIELSSELTKLVATVGHSLSFAEFTCDKLGITEGGTVSLGDTALTIYARLCFANARGPLILDCKKAKKLSLLIYASQLPENFVVRILNLDDAAVQEVRLAIASGNRGVRLSKFGGDKSVSVVNVVRPEPAELAFFSGLTTRPGGTTKAAFRNE